MSIYSPYFYVIKHLPTGTLYIGQKYGKDAYPEDFMTEHGYQTSSPKIHEIIQKDGLDSFEIIRLKLFDVPQEAYDYESRFLKRIKPNTNDKVFNTHSNDVLAFGTVEFQNAMLKAHGVTSYPLHPDFQKKKTDSNQRRYGVDHSMQNMTIQQRAWDTNMKKRGVMYPMQDPIVVEKQKETSLKRYGVTNPGQSDNAKIKRRKTSLKKFGTETHISQRIVREKSSITLKNRYGEEIINPFQLESVIQKINGIKQNYSELRKQDIEWKEMIDYVKSFTGDQRRIFFKGWDKCKKENLKRLINDYRNCTDFSIYKDKKKKAWYTNGTINIKIDFDSIPPDGFKPGRKS